MPRTILLLFGGESSEHDVSVASARNVYAAIDSDDYTTLLCYIDKTGKWWLLDDMPLDISVHGAPQLIPVLGSGSFVTLPATRVIKPDVLLPILHGKNGEDGTIAALGALLHIPVAGCDMTAAAICMDKLATKEILAANNIPVVPYAVHRAGESLPDYAKLTMKLGSPLFVKPCRAGSSVGVSKVFSEEELAAALALAHEHDAVALIEHGVSARELEVSVLGNPPVHEASDVGEVRPESDFYSYEAKYASGSAAQVIVPAELGDDQRQDIRGMALLAYQLLGCRGLARVDFFLTADGALYLSEVNTLPGFTNISMYPKLWRHSGVGYGDLIGRVITSALEPGVV